VNAKNARVMIARRKKSRGRRRIGLCQLHKALRSHHSTPPKTSAESRRANPEFIFPSPPDPSPPKPISTHHS
jgi:hypothetical protein